ncbi:hypothetical protein KVV02_002737 [Mortierella alpina]|uniref:Uncharacterized protein n=1 Tax=Mortierella alpina TaxID=64518 RepID=A0A9P7ZWQ2_MORAP|nr:hypothetical protein KVV02_002737 [Mortierella alpina]
MKSVFKSLFKRRSKRHNDSEPQCDPRTQYNVSLDPCCAQDHSSQREDSQHMSKNDHILTANAGTSSSTWRSTAYSLKGISSRHHSSRSSVIVHEDRQEPYDPRPICDIIQVQQQLNNAATTLLPPNDAMYANDKSGPNRSVNDDIIDECSQPHYEEGQHHHRHGNENESRMPLGGSPGSNGLHRQYFHPLPPPDHSSDNGAGVWPNQRSVLIGNASDNGDIKGKGKKRYTAPSESVERSTLGSRVQSRIFGNGNPYVVFHSMAQTTPNSTTPVITLGLESRSGSGSTRYESQPIPSDGVRHQGDDRIARIEMIMPSEPGLSKSQASGSEDDVDEMSSGTTASSANVRLRESSSLQHDNPVLSMHSDQSMSISAAENSQQSSASIDFRPGVRKTLSLEWCPAHKTLTTPVPPLRFGAKRSTALVNDSSSRPQRLANVTRSMPASEHSSQRVKGPRPIPNFEQLQNHKRRSRVLGDAGSTNMSSEGSSPISQSETTEQDDSNLVLITRTSTVPQPNHLQHLNVPKGQVQASEQQPCSTYDRPSSVVVEMSSHNAGSAEQLMQDVLQFVTDTSPQKTHVPYPPAPIPIPVPKACPARHPSTESSNRAHGTFGASTLPEAPSSPITPTGPSTKRLSNTTSRGTARRIIYSADLEQGLPEGRIARVSNFEIVPSNRVSISSRTNSSATASRHYTQPSQFAEGVDIQDFSTATIVVQSNKRGFGRVRSSEAAQRPSNNVRTAAINAERQVMSSLPEPVDLHDLSDSDEEVDAARYKAEVLKCAAVEAANAANVAAAKASAAAAEVVEARATRRRLRNERALKIPVQACGTSCDDPEPSKDSVGN